jgi:hypothetical protein
MAEVAQVTQRGGGRCGLNPCVFFPGQRFFPASLLLCHLLPHLDGDWCFLDGTVWAEVPAAM